MKTILKSIIFVLLFITLFLGSILFFYYGHLEYTKEIEVNVNIEHVNAMFKNIFNMINYLPEAEEIILISGKNNIEGSKYRIMISTGGDSVEVLATLTNNNLPHNLTMIYEMPDVINIMEQKHEEIEDNKTLIINKQKFQFSGLMKIISFFEPEGFNLESFQEQTNIYLRSFKNFTESEF